MLNSLRFLDLPSTLFDPLVVADVAQFPLNRSSVRYGRWAVEYFCYLLETIASRFRERKVGDSEEDDQEAARMLSECVSSSRCFFVLTKRRCSNASQSGDRY